MVPFLYTPREHHSVRSVAEYRSAHARVIAERARLGARYTVHEDDTPLAARVDANSWVVDCVCGAGNSTDPEWGIACCFGCGCVHTNVRFPPDHREIATLLTARSHVPTRGWRPGETLADLLRELEGTR